MFYEINYTLKDGTTCSVGGYYSLEDAVDVAHLYAGKFKEVTITDLQGDAEQIYTLAEAEAKVHAKEKLSEQRTSFTGKAVKKHGKRID